MMGYYVAMKKIHKIECLSYDNKCKRKSKYKNIITKLCILKAITKRYKE